MNMLLEKCNEIVFAALILGTVTLGICLHIDCFPYCCINFQEFVITCVGKGNQSVFAALYIRNVTTGIC